ARDSHIGGRGDKAAKVRDVRVQKDCPPRHSPACPTREDARRESRARAIVEEGSESAVGVGRGASRGTTGDGNSFTSLKALAVERYGAATCGIECRAIPEPAGRVLISNGWRTGIGALFETHSSHNSPWWGEYGIGAVIGRRVPAIGRLDSYKKPTGGASRDVAEKDSIAVEWYAA